MPTSHAVEQARLVFSFGRVQGPLGWTIAIIGLGGAIALVLWLYHRDLRELSRLRRYPLVCMRLLVIILLWLWLLQPQWQVEKEQVRDSELVLLVDTSASMTLADMPPETVMPFGDASNLSNLSNSDGNMSAVRRWDVVEAILKNRTVMAKLNEQHVLRIYGFDSGAPIPIAAPLEKGKLKPPDNTAETQAPPSEPESLPEESGLAVAEDTSSELLRISGPNGSETRLGYALHQVLEQHGHGPLSAIILFSDGCQNAGISPEMAVALARRNGIPIFTIGLGSNRPKSDLRLAQLEAPQIIAPNDPFKVRAAVQAWEMQGVQAMVELRIVPEQGSGQAAPLLQQQKTITLGENGELRFVEFDAALSKPGRFSIDVSAKSRQGEDDLQNNTQQQLLQVVDRPLKVLLFAGGPTREYRYLRTLLSRNKSTTVHILLQTAQEGISQEADEILWQFPDTAAELFSYDCLIAIDPDWNRLTSDPANLPKVADILEKWVADQAAGVLLVAGQVHAGTQLGGWLENERLEKVRALYPVDLPRQTSVLEYWYHASTEPIPLELTPQGQSSQFLWLEETAKASLQRWTTFPGVYSYFNATVPKAGAVVLARLLASEVASPQMQPIYFAEQFYGAGRVFYIASPEMWRLRMMSETYFERFYLQLLRHLCHGRFSRQSQRGVLLLERHHFNAGQWVTIRARVLDPQLRPLQVDAIPLVLTLPDGTTRTITLKPHNTPGMYVAQFVPANPGTYRLQLPLPDSESTITEQFIVDIADLERQSLLRNDELLKELAQKTGGRYCTDVPAAFDPKNPQALYRLLRDASQRITILEPPQQPTPAELIRTYWGRQTESYFRKVAAISFLIDRPLAWWLISLCCLLLFSEWTIRRLSRLA